MVGGQGQWGAMAPMAPPGSATGYVAPGLHFMKRIVQVQANSETRLWKITILDMASSSVLFYNTFENHFNQNYGKILNINFCAFC